MNLIEQIHEDWIVHQRDWALPGFRAVAVYRFGVWRMQFDNALIRLPLSFIYRRLYYRIRNRYGIELPHSAKIGRRLRIEHQSAIVVHGECEIGDDCVIRQGVTLGSRYLDRPMEAPILGDRVNVGAGAQILGGVRIGNDANIGANSVVLKDVGVGETAVGIPAKILAPTPPSRQFMAA